MTTLLHTFLFEVSSVFTIPGRGICLEGLRHTQLERVARGDLVELRRPDDSACIAEVVAVIVFQTYVKPHPPIEERLFPVLLPPSLTKTDVPLGTTVWRIGRTLKA